MDAQTHEGKKRKAPVGLWVALVIGAALCFWIIATGFRDFIEGYFYGALLSVSVAVGALGVRLIYALTGGRWGEPLKKYFVAASRTLPAALLLWVPVFFWLPQLYEWARPLAVAADPKLAQKAVYLNAPFFIIRSIFYFAVWIFALWWLERRTEKTDLSGFLSVAFFLVGSFAAMDWVMSLQPRWYSTMFAGAFVTGQVLLGYCFLLLVEGFGKQPGRGAPGMSPGGFIDRGSLMLTMVLFWAYLTFSHFLIIWMGNKPDEITWYLSHIRNGWGFMVPVIIIGHLFLPLFMLLNRTWKTSPAYLASIALIVILMRMSDIGWMVFTGFSRAVGSLTLTHAGAAIVVVSLFLLLFSFLLVRGNGVSPYQKA